MKKLLLFCLFALALSACDNSGSKLDALMKECPNATGVYKKHHFELVSIYTDADKRYTRECTQCGLKYKFGGDLDNLEYPKHYGAIIIVCNPQTEVYDTYYLSYYDYEDKKEHYDRLSINDFIKKENKVDELPDMDEVMEDTVLKGF